MKKFFFSSLIIILMLLVGDLCLCSAAYGSVLSIENDYIRIFVNNTELEQSRFGIDVTGGDPTHERDNEQPLIYGHPEPWASYTTVNIDGEYYVFGTETQRRAGVEGKYGEVNIEPEITEDNQILSSCIMDGVKVYQKLGLTKNITTGFPDTARIMYTVINTTDQRRKIGLRMMIDTLLGKNDGAPFRIRDEAVESHKKYEKNTDLPEYWQAFDSLSQPAVISQGTLIGPELTPPDEVYVADWGSLADGVWDFDFKPGRDFIRRGEFERDSAIALYWNPEPLEPGERRSYVTYYGLGGMTMMPGMLRLGVVAPEEVVIERPDTTFTVTAYLENTTDFEARDLQISIELPAGLTLAPGEKETHSLNSLKAYRTEQVSWEVMAESAEEMNHVLVVRAEASNTDDNRAQRKVKTLSPPKLLIFWEQPEQLEVRDNRLYPHPFTLEATVKNVGHTTAYGIVNQLITDDALKPAPGELLIKHLGRLKPDESIRIPWQFYALKSGEEINYNLEVKSRNAETEEADDWIDVPQVESKAVLTGPEEIEVGQYLAVDIELFNIPELLNMDISLRYNSTDLKLVEVVRGTLFIDGEELLPWEKPQIEFEKGEIRGIRGQLSPPQFIDKDTAATLYFRTLRPVETEIRITETILSSGEEEIEVDCEPCLIKISDGD